MKKIIALSLLAWAASIGAASAQVYSPYLAGYSGFNTITYPFGYYQGSVVNGVANGTGTFYYYADGSFYHGNFYQGFWDGPGVFVSRAYGYISGCFSRGNYAGQCVNVNNPYQSAQRVQNVVSEVYDDMPGEASNNPEIDPDGYKITQIDPNTQLGKSLLGGYSSTRYNYKKE